ncbi:hypothetical protein RFI_39274 [Reticulomyxa filosa]|uniref:Uncharacterized protein n=1 Tax=Reticulomyxa filosa TaxID=46433 RepID=X6LAS3_RETFI|nr:hypothetical protein RFI_39274 [Reticulomyxa filosa]|eukprot:ETN98236.1 hypothetical protein RFI_39274 [Reticulomyxa filosa]
MIVANRLNDKFQVVIRKWVSRTKNKFSEKGLDNAEYIDPFMEFKKNDHKLYSVLRQQGFFNDVVSEFRRYTVMLPSYPLEHFSMMSNDSNSNSFAIPKSPFAQENVLSGSRVILVGNIPLVNAFVGEAAKQIQKIRTFLIASSLKELSIIFYIRIQ